MSDSTHEMQIISYRLQQLRLKNPVMDCAFSGFNGLSLEQTRTREDLIRYKSTDVFAM
jgi:hypothetical protein